MNYCKCWCILICTLPKCVCYRSGRRQILNDQELVDMLIKDIPVDAELIDFSGMSFKEQVGCGPLYKIHFTSPKSQGRFVLSCIYILPV